MPTLTPPPLVRIYWPTSLVQQQKRGRSKGDGWLVGWYTQTATQLHTLCVATLLEDAHHSAADISACLIRLQADRQLASIWQHAGSAPLILGRVGSLNKQQSTLLSTTTSFAPLLIRATLPSTSHLPLIHAIDTRSSANSAAALPSFHCQLVLFLKPKPGTFIAATPFPFRSAFSSSSILHSDEDEPEAADGSEWRGRERCSDLTVALRQINSCWKLQEQLTSGLEGSTADSQRPSTYPTTAQSLLPSTLLNGFLPLVSVLTMLARWCLTALEYPLPSFLSYLSSQPTTRPRVQDISTFASQLRFRLLCLLHWPALYRSSQLPPSPSAAYHASSLLLWSSVGSVVMDMVLGVLLCQLLRHHTTALLSLVREYSQLLHASFIASTVTHFQQQPAGLKLHPQLSSLFTQYVHTTLAVHSRLIGGWQGDTLIRWLSVVGLLGASMLLSLCSDALSVLTAHVDLLHMSFSFLYRLFVSLLSSLFLLFRGKKRNLLRQRIDTLTPSTPALLLGVLLFCLLLLLLPTVVVYYAFFAVVRLLLMGGQAMLWWLLATCNCFPWVGLAVWLLRRGGLPGGVQLERTIPDNDPRAERVDGGSQLQAEESEQEAVVRREMVATRTSEDEAVVRYRHVMELEWSVRGGQRETESVVCDCVRLVSVSVPLRALFFQYRVALSYLQRHYNAKQLLLSLLRGQRLPTAPPSSAALAVFASGVEDIKKQSVTE